MEMEIEITLPDGRRRSFPEGVRAGDVLSALEPDAVRGAIGVRVDGQIFDLQTPLTTGGPLEIIKLDDDTDDAKLIYRHSFSHILAQAVKRLYPEARLAIGPAIAEGFYYDFDVPQPFTPDDLERIGAEMAKIVEEDHPFERIEVSPEEARRICRQRNEPYKLELVEELTSQDEKISFYRDGDFLDLCRGPHLPRTGLVRHFRLLEAAGAYWRGDERNRMLQRIYGTAFLREEDLERHLWRLEEARRRDHRRIGKQLELFHFDPTAPGMPYWLPKGLKVLNALIEFWREEHEKRGYQEIASPLINEKSLWVTSGHWEHFKDDMFIIPVDEQTTFGLKPMNCPNAMVVYNLKTRSYRDLPLRLADCDVLHRNERSGTLHGLLRVQKFQQDDAHIFVTEDQIEEEYDRILEIADHFYRIFDLKYSLRLGTRPERYLGDIETWDRAEAALKRILDERVGPGNYETAAGEGAFYGPKIDILMEDVLGRSWQMGTIQLDFQLPRRFDCTYIDPDGHPRTPVVIHRVIYGSLERFIGILIEHTAGALPVWLAPVQAVVLPIAERHHEYAQQVLERLKASGLRAELDGSSNTLNYRIRVAQTQKVPYMLVVGDREVESRQVAVRLRTQEDLGAKPLEEFLAWAQEKVRTKAQI